MTSTHDKQWDELDGPLFEAAENGEVFRAQQLLAAGANPNARDGGRMTPLHAAAVHGHLDIFRLLLANGADITATTVRGRTPLQLAEMNDHTDIIGFSLHIKNAAAPVPVMKTLKLKVS
ncbi:MAG: ankyrin repeat domain-containing protein [Alphaproteobacteria bacterium]|nr:MAG: ankyrin repeat domain-containing protein [Alphaproteobacteria bacterium]